jgi:CHAD domain-containing protein
MVQLTTPVTILQSHAAALRGQLPRVFDGDKEGVHDARVATRRIREVLPLTREWHRRNVDGLAADFKRVGRALGAVRDADVRIALLSYLEAHVPAAAASLVVMRQRREHKRLHAMRRLIKRFERLDVERLIDESASARLQPLTTVLGSWRQQLAHAIAERARTARAAIDHMTGVYFPNRAHTTRIALKKFRYGAEIAAATRIAPMDDSIRALRKAQDILGELHDRQVLVDKLPDLATPEHKGISEDHVRLVIQALDAECRELHHRYVDHRDRLLDVCSQAERIIDMRRAAAAATVTAGVVAVSSAAYAWRRLSGARDAGANHVIVAAPAGRHDRAAS